MRTRHLRLFVVTAAGAATVLAAPGVEAATAVCNPAGKLVGWTVVDGNPRAGRFVASGINRSHGHAIGSYRC